MKYMSERSKIKVKPKVNSRRKSSKSVGASRKAKVNKFSHFGKYFKILVRLLAILSVVGAVVGVIFLVEPKRRLEKLTHKAIQQVQIEGSFHFFDKEKAEAIIAEQVTDSFIELNIEQLKLSLEQNAWIDSVSVAREWPDKLIVKITEHQAIARWGENSFLNMRGDIIPVESVEKITDLPFLRGDDSNAKKVMQQYLQVGKLFDQYGLTLASLELDEKLAWTLKTSADVTVKLGANRAWEKLQSLMNAKDGVLDSKFNDIQKIDMRYPSGFAVAWKTDKANKLVLKN